MKSEDDVVVTGLGVVSPIGVGMPAALENLSAAKSGIRLREGFADTPWPFRAAGTIEDFEPKQYIKPRKSIKLMCREIQFGFGAATIAIDDAGLDPDSLDSDRFGVICGTDTFYCDPGSITDSFWIENRPPRDVSEWIGRAVKTIEPLWMLKYLPNMIASHVAIAWNARGPNNSVIQGDVSGMLALIEAADVIRRNWADVMIVGGTGSKINSTYLAYHGIDHLADPDPDPATACRPFDAARRGTVPGEGAGVIVLERRSHAEARDARIYGTVAGSDYGFFPPGDSEESKFHARKIRSAMERGGLSNESISHVNSHAGGLLDEDKTAAESIEQALGTVPVAAYKSYFGDLGPAGPIIEACISLHSLTGHPLPATLNCDQVADECPVNVQTTQQNAAQSAFVKTAISHTGQIAAIAFSK